jgi:hypothetical protein
VGFNSWTSQDISDDRFINNFGANANAKTWLIQGDRQIYTSAQTSSRTIRSANIDGFRHITLDRSAKLALTGSGNEGFSVSGGMNVTSITSFNEGATSASRLTLNLDAALVLGKAYRVTHPKFGKATTTSGQIMNSEGFNSRFIYTGDDLENTYPSQETRF